MFEKKIFATDPSDECTNTCEGNPCKPIVNTKGSTYNPNGGQTDNLSFLELNDTPDSYVGEYGKVPTINQGETGLEFVEIPLFIQEALDLKAEVLEYANFASFPTTGQSGKIYIAVDTNITYRWGGSSYVAIGSSLALGETSSTAYRGDRGKEAYDHSQITSGNPHNVTKAEVGLSAVSNIDATQRANHTGTQPASTISDFTAAADARVVAGIAGKQDILTETNFGDFMDVGLSTKLTPSASDTLLARDSITNEAVEIPFNTIQPALGFTPENTANKSTSTSDSASTVKFPVWSAILSYFDTSRIKNLLGITTLSGSNTGDETTATIQSKRPLKTIEGQSLEGSGNIDLTKADVGLSKVQNIDTLSSQGFSIFDDNFEDGTAGSDLTLSTGWTVGSDGIAISTNGGFGNSALFNKYTTIDRVSTRALVEIINTSSVFSIIRKPNFGLNQFGTVAEINCSTNQLRFYGSWDGSTTVPSIVKSINIPFTIVANGKYLVELLKIKEKHIFRLTDTTTLSNTVELVYDNQVDPSAGAGRQWAAPGVMFISGSIKLKRFTYASLFRYQPKVLITGHSFVEGYALINQGDVSKSYSNLLYDDLAGSVAIAGRGGEGITTINTREDINYFLPSYHLVDIGANDTVYATWLTGIQDYINKILAKNSIPILCTIVPRADRQAFINQANDFIRSSGYNYVDFAKAVTLNNDGLTQNPALFSADNVHPNIAGNAKMFEQIKVDAPYLWDGKTIGASSNLTKSTALEIDNGTNDDKYITPLGLASTRATNTEAQTASSILVSKFLTVANWAFFKTQIQNITGRWQFAGIGAGIASNVASFLNIAVNTASLGQILLPPSAVDYTGTISGMIWNNASEFKFYDNLLGIVNRFIKLNGNVSLVNSNALNAVTSTGVGGNLATLPITAAFSRFATPTSYTISLNDVGFGWIIAVTDTTTARTITLPLANTVPSGWFIVIKDESGLSGANAITIARSGADLIDGATSSTINSNYMAKPIYSDGVSKWFIM